MYSLKTIRTYCASLVCLIITGNSHSATYIVDWSAEVLGAGGVFAENNKLSTGDVVSGQIVYKAEQFTRISTNTLAEARLTDEAGPISASATFSFSTEEFLGDGILEAREDYDEIINIKCCTDSGHPYSMPSGEYQYTYHNSISVDGITSSKTEFSLLINNPGDGGIKSSKISIDNTMSFSQTAIALGLDQPTEFFFYSSEGSIVFDPSTATLAFTTVPLPSALWFFIVALSILRAAKLALRQ